MEIITRLCRGCNISKSLTSEFFMRDKHNSSGFTYRCKICRNKESKKWSQKNPDKVKLANDNNRHKRKEFYSSPEGVICSRKSWLKKVYGLSLEEYNKMLENQNYVCAICGSKHTHDRWGVLAVDHNHTTGQIRGLLCYKCNTAIGMLNENINIISNSINYLKKYNNEYTPLESGGYV